MSGPRLDQFTFHNCLKASWAKSHALRADLSRLIFVDMYVLAELATLMTRAVQAGWTVMCSLPVVKGRDTYLARMHFFDVLPPQVIYDRTPPVVNERAMSLVPLMKLDIEAGEAGIQALAEWVYPQLPEHLAEGFTQALAEIGTNVVSHAEAETGFVVGQRYEKDHRGQKAPRVHLVVADAGIGIKASLARGKPEVASMSEHEAILLAKEWYVTSKPEVHSGLGLSTVEEFAQMFGGRLRIRSGSATVVTSRSGEQTKQLPGIEGTVVSVELASPGRR